MDRIHMLSNRYRIPCGVHVVMPDAAALQQRVTQGYRFIAYSIDAVFLAGAAELAIRPDWKDCEWHYLKNVHCVGRGVKSKLS